MDQDAFGAVLKDPAFAEIERHPQTGIYGRAYYPAVYGNKHRTHSFAILLQDKPILVVLCSSLDGVLGLHGLPLRIFAGADIDSDLCDAAIDKVFSHLDVLADLHHFRDILVRERASGTLSAIGEACIRRTAEPTVSLIGVVDLEAGPVAWKRSLRKRFQQFINWGKRSLEIRYINARNFSNEAFDVYRLFHAEIAGRVTRPRESWDEMYRAVSEGRGELLLANLDGKLAAGSLFIDGRDVTLYMNGVYDRNLNKPLAHFMMWHGIERAHERGMKSLQLGDIHIQGVVDDKRFQIGYFKRGFATDIESYFDWRWRVKSDSQIASAAKPSE